MEEMVSRIDDVLSTRRAPAGDPEEDEEQQEEQQQEEEEEERSQDNGSSQDRFHAELQEWSLLSRELRRLDLPLLHPPQPASASSELRLDLQQSAALRVVIRALLSDCDRRQSLLQDLIEANAELKQELQRQRASSSRLERKAKDLKELLETSARRIQDLTEEGAMREGLRATEGARERNTKELAANRARQLERRNQQLEQELLRVRGKLMSVTAENEERQRRQRKVFLQLKHRQVGKASPMDEKLLDIIDGYEQELQALRKERDLLGGAGEDAEGGEAVCEEAWGGGEASVNYRALVKELQRKLQASDRRACGLEERGEVLRLELEGRPAAAELQQALGRLRRCEKLLREHGISPKPQSRVERQGQPAVYSTAVADLDFLPPRQCRERLAAVCRELAVDNLDDLLLVAKRHRRLAELHPGLEDFRRAAQHLVDSPSAPPLPAAFYSARTQGTPQEGDSADPTDAEEAQRACLAALEFWLDQLSALPELRAALLRLHGLLFPWRGAVAPPGQEMCAIVGFVDSLTETDPETERLPAAKDCPENVAQGLVGHFQRLFDCPRLDAVYTRMADVYGKLGELRNVLGNIAQEVGLAREENPAVVFEAVLALTEERERLARGQLHRQVGPEQLASALEKLEQYDDFFPTFHQLVQDLLRVLDLDSIERILPAVKSLKRCVDL